MACCLFSILSRPQCVKGRFKWLWLSDVIWQYWHVINGVPHTQPKINSLRPSDAIWWHRSGSTLAQVMACCLTAPSHYLNQCWLITCIKNVYFHWEHWFGEALQGPSLRTRIGSDNGLLPIWHQAVNWTNAGLLLIWSLDINFSEILVKIQNFLFMKKYSKCCLWNGSHVIQGEISWMSVTLFRGPEHLVFCRLNLMTQ